MAAADLAVEAQGVHKFYGALHVLHGIDLEVRRGQVVVVVGPSGSGKSTLLRCLNHLETVQRGWIRVCGELVGYRETARGPVELRDAEVARHRRRIGMVFQQFNLFPHLTAIGNIMAGPLHVLGESRARALAEARRLLALVGLPDKADAYPEMISEVLDVMVALSKQGMTMIVVTHEMGFARAVADRVVFVDEGRVVEDAAPAEFFTRPRTERGRAFLDKILH